jgi:hypothetical protein
MVLRPITYIIANKISNMCVADIISFLEPLIRDVCVILDHKIVPSFHVISEQYVR